MTLPLKSFQKICLYWNAESYPYSSCGPQPAARITYSEVNLTHSEMASHIMRGARTPTFPLAAVDGGDDF